MKTLISILLILGFTSNSTVKKRILSYPVVISSADLIVEGEISDVSFFVYEYDFKITEFIKGESEQEITINMWKEWTCDARIKRPKKSQRLLLFLTKKQNGEYEIINGSTGELFISENDGIKTFGNSDFPKLNELKLGIKMFSKSYEYNGSIYSSYNEKTYFKQLVKQSEIEKMMTENGFFKSLVLWIKPKVINN